MIIIKSKDLSDRSFPIGLKCKSVEQAKTWLGNLTRVPGAEEEDKAAAEEQSLIEQDDLFINSAPEETPAKPASKVDENNNLAKAKKAAEAAEALLQSVKDSEGASTAATSDLSTASTLESSIASLESATKSSAGNANADVLEDSTEATTAATDNLGTESLSSSSVDGKCTLRFTFYPVLKESKYTFPSSQSLSPRGGHLQTLPLLSLSPPHRHVFSNGRI